MNDNCYAVVMGFNHYKEERLNRLEYAVKDAEEVYSWLINPEQGGYPADNVVLLTDRDPDHVPTQKEIMEQLYTHVVHNRGEEDTVVVYYSGHGFIAGDKEMAYLAAPDVTMADIWKYPFAGIQMKKLHDDIFMASNAKNVVFFLDCCHSGAFCPNVKGSEARERDLVDASYYNKMGRVAFVSTPAKGTSRELKTLKHGVFTYFLLEALQGEAIESSGEITADSIIKTVKEKVPKSQSPVSYGYSPRIVLARPKNKGKSEDETTYQKYDSVSLRHLDESKVLPMLPLRNPIEQQIEYIDLLMQSLKFLETNRGGMIGSLVLGAIRRSVNADFAFIERIDNNGDSIKLQSDFDAPHTDLAEYKYTVLSNIFPQLTKKKTELLPKQYGMQKPFENVKDAGKCIISIPLNLENPREFLVLAGVPVEMLSYGEVLGHTLLAFYRVSNEFTDTDPYVVETGLLDATKRDFGHVPFKVYEKRLQMFKERLNQVVFAFEPIVQLGLRDLEIKSWEALARDPDKNRAPVDLFDAAELWGPEFITELDLYCLRNAVSEYVTTWREERKGQKKPDPLSVNVYPETLYRSVYKRELTRIVHDEDIIKPDKLVLEISEKRPVPRPEHLDEDDDRKDTIDLFMEKIQSYIDDLHINFAIDDFGVGYSSALRLIKLQLDHVKIDRDILRHPYPDCTLRYVTELVGKNHHHSATIVVEGFDGDSLISLKKLMDLKITHVQGHLFRKASQSVRDFTPEEQESILRLLK